MPREKLKAGSSGKDGAHKGRAKIGAFPMQCSQKSCGYCGKVEGTLRKCAGCKNVFYCSKDCQTNGWPEHKVACAEMRKMRKDQPKSDGFSMTCASAVGSLNFCNTPGAPCYVSYAGMVADEFKGNHVAEGAKPGLRRLLGDNFDHFMREVPNAPCKGRMEFFASVDDLDAGAQLMLACGPLDDLPRAQRNLPILLELSRGKLDLIRCMGIGYYPLEWAARKGNFAVAKWLATDPRTRGFLQLGAPVAWACYTNHVELAKMLVSHGADSRATDEVSYKMPPIHLAAENGSLLAVRWLVEEMGHDIRERNPNFDTNLRGTVRRLPGFHTNASLKAIDSYAKEKGVRPLR